MNKETLSDLIERNPPLNQEALSILVERNRSLRNLFVPTLLSRRINPDSGPERVIAYLTGKACKTHESITLLAEQRFGQDAAILVRTLINLDINLRWIDQDPDARAEMYLDYAWIVKERIGRTMMKRPDLLGIDGRPTLEQMEELQKYTSSEAATVRERHGYGSRDTWSKLSIKTMAGQTGMEQTYDFAYRLLSGLEHSDAASSSAYLIKGDDGKYQINIGQGYEWLREVLLSAHVICYSICELADRVLQLDLAKLLNEHRAATFDTSVTQDQGELNLEVDLV